jgi:hypothetical protein
MLMPEAAVYKDRKAAIFEQEIGLPWKCCGEGCVTQADAPEKLGDASFRERVAGFDAAHVRASTSL